ncbi:MAG: glycosyltransferase family 87 protein [Acidimicrobiales bacterium]
MRTVGHLLALFAGLGILALWLMAAYKNLALLDRDWVAFDRAGWRALSGDWSGVYRESGSERWPYLYPPFALPLSMPLGMLPYQASYWLTVAMTLFALRWSCRRLRELTGSQQGRYLVYCGMLVFAPTTLQVLVTGQYSALYLVALCAMATADGSRWPSRPAPPLLATAPQLADPAHGSAGSPTGVLQRKLTADPALLSPSVRRASYCLVLLALKPNLAVFAALFLMLSGQWQLLRRWVVSGLVVVAVTAPFAWAAWMDFVRAVGGVAQRQESGKAPVDKQATLLAFLRILNGEQSGSTAIWALWLVLVLPLLILFGITCYRVGSHQRYRLRLVGVTALVMVAANPRLYFYDALVLAVPAAAWYLDRASYARPRWRRCGGAALAGVVVVSGVFFWFPAVATSIGGLTALWAIVECLDLLRGAASVSLEPTYQRADDVLPVDPQPSSAGAPSVFSG